MGLCKSINYRLPTQTPGDQRVQTNMCIVIKTNETTMESGSIGDDDQQHEQQWHCSGKFAGDVGRCSHCRISPSLPTLLKRKDSTTAPVVSVSTASISSIFNPARLPSISAYKREWLSSAK